MQIVRQCSLGIWTVLPLLLCSVATTLPAGSEDFAGKQIAVIAFEPAQQPMPPAELSQILPLKIGEPLRMSAVRAAIERLYATGRYADVAVDAELKNGGVVLRFLTKNNWFVGRVSVSRVPEPPTRTEMTVVTKLDLGRQFLDEDTKMAVDNIRETLRNNGFYQSTVRPSLDYENRTQQVNFSFDVEPGKRDRLSPPVIKSNVRISRDEIVDATGWKGWFGWKPMTQVRVQRGLEHVRQRFQKKDYLMAQVSLEGLDHNAATGRTTPILSLDPGPQVSVEATGVKLDRDKLRQMVPVFEEQSVDQDLLVEGSRNLREYFQARGYFDTRVTFSRRLVEAGKQQVLFTIDRGERYDLVNIDIQGNHYFDLKTIRERMLITPTSLQIRHGRFSESLLRRDRDAITELYRSNGFRDAKVTSGVERNYGGKKGDLGVRIRIEEGTQWFVHDVSLEGVREPDREVILSMLQSSPGQPFSEANVATDRENILAYYYNGGYPDATFDWSSTPSSEPQQMNLRFIVKEGPRQFVREVLISGLKTTRPQLVNQQILLNPGDPISQAKMLETQRRLYDLGIFSQVDMAIQNPDGDEQNKYILYQLEESRKYSVTGGLGAEIARIGGSQTSLESPAGKAGFSPRVSFDFSRLNFLGRAHTVSFRSRVSNLQRRALVTYLAPQFRGHESLDLSFTTLFDDSRDIRTFSARRWEGSAQLGQRWTRSKTLLYRFAYRRVGVDENTLKIRPELIPILSQPVRVGMLSVGYLDDRRDNPGDSHRGTFNSLELGIASKGFGSEADFTRLLARNSTYHPLGSKLVLARTFAFGWLNPLVQKRSLPAEEQIPLPERFFSGGASTLRAFPQNQAGPRDPVTGFPVGGNALLIIGTELRFPIFGQNIGGVLFHDAGNVYSRVQDLSFRFHQRDDKDFNYMVHGFGLGVRIRTPVGPIRADISFSPNSPHFLGFNGSREELLRLPPDAPIPQTRQRINRFQFHFSLGQTF